MMIVSPSKQSYLVDSLKELAVTIGGIFFSASAVYGIWKLLSFLFVLTENSPDEVIILLAWPVVGLIIIAIAAFILSGILTLNLLAGTVLFVDFALKKTERKKNDN